MWNVIEKATEQVVVYSTIAGQAWYLIVFVFRLIVVATIGSSVYSDEQSAFRCSTKVIGCDNVCYDRFAKISHIRFWAFQLLALTSPIVIFHFYTINVQGKIEKLKAAEEKALAEAAAAAEAEKQDQKDSSKFSLKSKSSESNWDIVRGHVEDEVRRRRKRVGQMKQRQIYNKTKMEEVTFTRSIRFAYFCSVIARMTIEIIFLYLAFDLFRFAEYPNNSPDGRVVSDGRRVQSIFDLFWIRVPQLYRCGGNTVRWACGQHMLPGNLDSYVPCWVSRPWEKTIFLQYMNTLSVVCLVLSIIEIVMLSIRFCRKRHKKGLKQPGGFGYKEVPTAPSNDYQFPPLETKSSPNDEFYETNEDPKRSNLTTQDQAASENRKQDSDNLETDLKPGSIDMEKLRKVVRDEMKQLKKSSLKKSLTEGELTKPKRFDYANVKLPPKERRRSRLLKSVEEVDNLQPKSDGKKSKTRFQIPVGTQSLNRPSKLSKPLSYSALYRLGSISFSQSEEEEEDEGSSSGSSEETELASVSQHSTEYV